VLSSFAFVVLIVLKPFFLSLLLFRKKNASKALEKTKMFCRKCGMVVMMISYPWFWTCSWRILGVEMKVCLHAQRIRKGNKHCVHERVCIHTFHTFCH
jgi:hypothetical protein